LREFCGVDLKRREMRKAGDYLIGHGSPSEQMEFA
jgi:hypothetical protein